MNQNELVLECLNSAFVSDPVAIQALCCMRVPCNKELVNHPLIPIDRFPGDERFVIGVLGLLNGILSSAGLRMISTEFSETDDENGHRKMIGFSTNKS